MSVRKLSKGDDLSSFECGVNRLDHFLRAYAWQNQNDLYIGVTYVALRGSTVAGYATVSPSELRIDERASTLFSEGGPSYAYPVLRLGRLAVDKRYQGQGIGQDLVQHVFLQAVKMKDIFGCTGVLVDALSEKTTFYERLGFLRLELRAGKPVTHSPTVPMFIFMQELLPLAPAEV